MRVVITILLAAMALDSVNAQQAERDRCHQRCRVDLRQGFRDCVTGLALCNAACPPNNKATCGKSCFERLRSCSSNYGERDEGACIASCDTAFPLNELGTVNFATHANLP